METINLSQFSLVFCGSVRGMLSLVRNIGANVEITVIADLAVVIIDGRGCCCCCIAPTTNEVATVVAEYREEVI